jgi:hypothetical protein
MEDEVSIFIRQCLEGYQTVVQYDDQISPPS